MKKLIIALTSIFMMMMIIVSPLFVKPFNTYAATNQYGIADELNSNVDYVSEQDIIDYFDNLYPNGYMYVYMTMYSSSHKSTIFVVFDDADSITEDSNGYTVNIQNPTLNGGAAKAYVRNLYQSSQYNKSVNNNEISDIYRYITVNSSKTSISWNLQPSTSSSSTSAGMTRDNARSYDSLLELTNTLNVFVSFSPTLSGNVDRSINNNGVQSMRSQLYMQVVNQSRFPIQYKMAIYKTHQESTRSYDLTVSDNVFYDDDPIFIYYSDSWVYCTDCDSETTFLNSDTVKENKSSPWHYIDASSQDIVTFDFSQINLLEGEEYTVYVYAVKNDYGYPSEQIVYLASSDPALASLKQIQGDDIETVYQSNFTMINYNDVKYDPNNSNNGVKPFNGRDGFAATQQYSYSRNARENQDGTIDYSSRNLYTNENSWLSQSRSVALANHSTYNTQSIPASLSNHFNGFFALVNSIFSHLPKDIQSIYIYGFTALIVLGIIIKVVK